MPLFRDRIALAADIKVHVVARRCHSLVRPDGSVSPAQLLKRGRKEASASARKAREMVGAAAGCGAGAQVGVRDWHWRLCAGDVPPRAAPQVGRATLVGRGSWQARAGPWSRDAAGHGALQARIGMKACAPAPRPPCAPILNRVTTPKSASHPNSVVFLPGSHPTPGLASNRSRPDGGHCPGLHIHSRAGREIMIRRRAAARTEGAPPSARRRRPTREFPSGRKVLVHPRAVREALKRAAAQLLYRPFL